MKSFEKDMTFKPIGYISTPFKQKFTTPRQPALAPSAQGTIKFDRSLVPEGSLAELQGFSHIWLIFVFHKNSDSFHQGKIHPPRLNGEKVGVFATRSPHRPNNIGLSLVQLLEVDESESSILVSGLDLVDGTPILDIKPYILQHDFAAEATSGWLDKVVAPVFEVKWGELVEEKITKLQIPQNTLTLIQEILSDDVRNVADKKKNDPSQVFACHIHQWDFLFRCNELSETPFVEIVDIVDIVPVAK